VQIIVTGKETTEVGWRFGWNSQGDQKDDEMPRHKNCIPVPSVRKDFILDDFEH
jgi:hypothetical protein